MPYIPPHLREGAESSSNQPASGRSLADLEAKLPTVHANSRDGQRGKARQGGSYSYRTLGDSYFAAYISCSEGTHLLMTREYKKDRSPKIYFGAPHLQDVGIGDTEGARTAVLKAIHLRLGTLASPLVLQHMASVAQVVAIRSILKYIGREQLIFKLEQ